jgi:hypothetical protein
VAWYADGCDAGWVGNKPEPMVWDAEGCEVAGVKIEELSLKRPQPVVWLGLDCEASWARREEPFPALLYAPPYIAGCDRGETTAVTEAVATGGKGAVTIGSAGPSLWC